MTQLLLISRCKVWDTRLIRVMPNCLTQSGETSPEIIFAVRYEGPGMSEGAAFNAHWNTPLEAMNGTIDLADAYIAKTVSRLPIRR